MSSSGRSSSQRQASFDYTSMASGQEDDWSRISDPNERRRVQNRLAQRKFRDKSKRTREEIERDQENTRAASAAYETSDSDKLGAEEKDLSGLPWGSFSMKHVVKSGRDKERESQRGGGGGSSHEQAYQAGYQTYSSTDPNYGHGSGYATTSGYGSGYGSSGQAGGGQYGGSGYGYSYGSSQ